MYVHLFEISVYIFEVSVHFVHLFIQPIVATVGHLYTLYIFSSNQQWPLLVIWKDVQSVIHWISNLLMLQ